MKKQAIAVVLMLSASAIHAQNNTWQAPEGTSSLWEQFLDNLSDYDDIEAGSTEEMYEELRELEATHIDLNNATDDGIQRLVFLSNAQREELTEYLDRHRPIRSIGELAMIKSLDNVTLRLLNCFVYVGNIDESRKFPTWKEIAKHGKNELLGYVKVPFYERKGDREAYLGYKYKHWIRYKYSYGQLLQAGITGAQDAGEPFFGSHNKMGYDHYAFYVLARKLGKIRTLALGQYKARFGLGLVMNAGFGMGKTTSMVLATPQNSITANASRSEAAYLQGVASTIEIYKNITTTAFASYRKIDATLNDNSTIKTILKTGYHRTETEIKKRHNASQTTAGMNVNVKHNGISVGATAVYTAFSKDLKPDKSQVFRLYSPNGNNFWNVSIDYAYIHPRISVKGETATGNSHALATINTISLKASLTQAFSMLTQAARQHALCASAMRSTFLSCRLSTCRASFRVQVRSTTPLFSTVHSCSTLMARLPFQRLQSLCARVTAVRTSLWAASSCVQTSTSHGRLQRLRLWVQAVLLQSSAARKLRLRRKLAKTFRRSSQKRKTSTQRSSQTRTRQLLTAISTT